MNKYDAVVFVNNLVNELGVFVFKREAKLKNSKTFGKKNRKITSILSQDDTEQLFYKIFTKTWSSIENDIIKLQKQSHTNILEDLINYVENAYKENFDNFLPVAALLTGVNQPDHFEQFENIKTAILDKLKANVAIIRSRDCATIKAGIETMVRNLIEESNNNYNSPKKIRKSQMTMRTLENWYINQSERTEKTEREKKRLVVVILPDFEYFNTEIIQDFILILNSYCSKISIVLIFGVATAASAIHNMLSYRVTKKIKLKLFQSVSAICTLNKIFDEIVLSPKYNFNFSGKVLKFLNDIFIFYDFSINGFVQELKYCLLEHFLQGNIFSLCTDYNESIEYLKYFSHNDFEILRQLPSFRSYIENIKNPVKVIAMFVTSKYWMKKLGQLLQKCHIYFKIFRCFIVFLTSLVEDLPKSPLGKLRKELYSNCMSKDIIQTEAFIQCWKILELMSKDEFISKIIKAINDTNLFIENNLNDSEIDIQCRNIIFKKLKFVEKLLNDVRKTGIEDLSSKNSNTEQKNKQTELKNLSRQQLKEKILQLSKEEIPVSNFLQSIQKILDYIKIDIVFEHLSPPHKRGPTFYELFLFSDIILTRKHIIGTPRAALHTALNDPYFYLQCDCCELDNMQSLKETLPDLSVAYKLHLECGKLINLFDWMSAFRSIVDYEEEENEQIDPKIQARFTRAVAELQFTGYVKSSKRKTDHVTRLTW